MIEVRQGKRRSLYDPKVKFLTLMPQSDGTKVGRAKKRQVARRLVAVQATRVAIAGVMKDFLAKMGRQAAMEGFVPGAVVFFLEVKPELLAANIPKHILTPYFVVTTVEEWAANNT